MAAGRFFTALYRWSSLARIPTCRRIGVVSNHRTRSNGISTRGNSGLIRVASRLSQGRRALTNTACTGAAQSASAISNQEENGSQASNNAGSPSAVGDGERLDPHSSAQLFKHLSPHMRSLMRHIPHPVVIITASEPSGGDVMFFRTPSGNHISPQARAMTVSSFTTVTLTPNPIISFNIKSPSRTLDAILKRERFRVHILTGTSAGARIADAFARGVAEDGFKALDRQGLKIVQKYRAPWAPRITGEGVRADLVCTLLPDKCVAVADHVIIVAEVQRINPLEYENDTTPALMYEGRAYKSVGPAIDLKEGLREGFYRPDGTWEAFNAKGVPAEMLVRKVGGDLKWEKGKMVEKIRRERSRDPKKALTRQEILEMEETEEERLEGELLRRGLKVVGGLGAGSDKEGIPTADAGMKDSESPAQEDWQKMQFEDFEKDLPDEAKYGFREQVGASTQDRGNGEGSSSGPGKQQSPESYISPTRTDKPADRTAGSGLTFWGRP